jgi:hypothetical protein
MAVAPVIPLIIGTVVAAGASAYAGYSAYQQGKYQEKVASNNARFQRDLGERNAAAVLAASRAEQARFRRESQRRLAATRAGIAGSGFRLEGTPLELMGDQASEAEENAMLIRHAGRVNAQQARFGGAIDYRNSMVQGQSAMMAGTSQAIGAYGQAGSTLLTGYGTYIQYNQ